MVENMAERSVQGLGNTQNEDQTLCMAFESYPAHGRYQLIALAAVADGISSGGGGHIASTMVVKELEMRFTQKNNRVFDGRTDIDAYFENTCREINHLLLNGRHKNQRYRGSTTLVLAGVFRDSGRNQNELLVINAGDSPLYTLDTERGEMKPLSETHIDEMGAVTRCFGSHDFKIYREWHPCPKNGFIFLCSDGVTGKSSKRWVGDEEVKRCLLETKTPDEAAGKLIMLAQQRGSKDDISVVILEMGKPGRASTARTFVSRYVMIIAGALILWCIVAGIAGVVAIKKIKNSTPVNNTDTKNVSKTGTKEQTSTQSSDAPQDGNPPAPIEKGNEALRLSPESKGKEPKPKKYLFTEGDFEEFARTKLMETHLEKVKESLIRDKLTTLDTDTLSILNSLLAKPSFYDDLPNKKRSKLSKEIQRLVNETEGYRHIDFQQLDDIQHVKIHELNRRILEALYPDEIPSTTE